MKIINQFLKLQKDSKFALRFHKYSTEVFCGSGPLEFGVKILLSNGKPLVKEYEKFKLYAALNNTERIVFIESKVENTGELVLFAHLIEYILFELGKKSNATPVDIKNSIDDFLKFSSGKASEISIEKQIGLIGELLIFQDLLDEFPDSNQLNNWHGPEGYKIDFIFSNKFGIEVKSRIQPFKDWISISSSEQLDNDLEAQHLAVCDFLPSDTGKTLKDITDEVIIKLDDHEKVNEFIEKMRKGKFDYFTNYSNLIKVTLFKKSYFDTKTDSFPILKREQNIRIDKIKYDININGLTTINFMDSLAKIRSQLELY
jgi:hypothetical protein